jgi:hypothetical protein
MLNLFDKKFFKTAIGFGAILAIAGVVLSMAGYYYESNLKLDKLTTQANVVNTTK